MQADSPPDTLYKNGLKPSWANDELLKNSHNGPASDGKIVWVERKVALGGGGTETYRYWAEEKNGKFINGGWDTSSASPDFLWRPQTESAFTGRNERNPFVDPKLVKEIYEASIRWLTGVVHYGCSARHEDRSASCNSGRSGTAQAS